MYPIELHRLDLYEPTDMPQVSLVFHISLSRIRRPLTPKGDSPCADFLEDLFKAWCFSGLWLVPFDLLRGNHLDEWFSVHVQGCSGPCAEEAKSDSPAQGIVSAFTPR